MQIKQLANASGVNAKTIRYYEDIGLLPMAERNLNGYRVYKQNDVSSLKFIRRCKDLRMPLADIQTLVAVQNDESASCEQVDALILRQLEQIQIAQAELRLLEGNLRDLANCCEYQIVKDCQILQQLRST